MSGLVTDLYELTMAFAYWQCGMSDHEAAFSVTFREHPFHGGFTIACGLAPVVEFLESFRYDDEAIAYLRTLRGNDGQPLFSEDFLSWLRAFRFTCDVDAVPEGTVVFPHEPLLRVTGPIIEAHLAESAILNILNFQSLIATKAARVVLAAGGDRVIDFGLRRAQGLDGALSASRAAYIGGCSATSNVLAARAFGIPAAGTVAHSFIMAFDDELRAMQSFFEAMPNNAILLVDTYNTIEGVRKAIEAGRSMRERGAKLAGIRLDSGDLAYLSNEARKMLDAAGFPDASIAASNDLDEHLIESLKQQGAKIDAWGVGTRLVTGWDQPALGGVYKLNAIRKPGGAWEPRIKLSEQVAKTSNPGLVRARRFTAGGECIGDALYDEAEGLPDGDMIIVDPLDATRRKLLPRTASQEELLTPVMRHGKRVADLAAPGAIRELVTCQLARFHRGIKRFVNPHQYPVGLDERLYERKTKLILAMRGAGA